ncbi:glycosyl/glycerophosphate transferase [Microbacterium mangrovi]|uniref:Glycosyl/glycerophosphate transferase n=1 Tax=Microbacterium mangrovi TaxID=1348253 RepID=A0A0B2A230_9MICO|nr:CDP-glycerol glycerophosphotransferase family protein [Microbacterium mangrovi]KHK97554.1 glycosyl/glycerophosphate transferase [Microbacterium mangrovi]
MASFSFGAGNAAKLLRIPLYAAGRLLTLIVPRTRDEWVFGCGGGIGDGALALWRIAADEGVDAVWLVENDRDATDARALGIPTLPKHSAAGFWRTARARVIVITHGFGDVNRYAVSGGFVVQLWHGIPLKRIGVDSPETLRPPGIVRGTFLEAPARLLLGIMYRAASRRIDVLPAASHLVRGRLQSAFALRDDAVPVTGEPRVDVLSAGEPRVRHQTARALIAEATGEDLDDSTRIVLYAPTWRDGEEDPAIPDADAAARIADLLDEQDAVLLIRSHPLGAGAYDISSPRVRMIGSDRLRDITPALPGVDVLITDYSSLAYDSSLVPMPVVYLAPDVTEYAQQRGFYGRYEDVAGDDWARTWPEALAQLHGILSDPHERERRVVRAEALDAEVHAFSDGESTRRVFDLVRLRVARADEPARAAS